MNRRARPEKGRGADAADAKAPARSRAAHMDELATHGAAPVVAGVREPADRQLEQRRRAVACKPAPETPGRTERGRNHPSCDERDEDEDEDAAYDALRS